MRKPRNFSNAAETSVRRYYKSINNENSKQIADDDLCFYHRSFGSASRQCRPRCKYWNSRRNENGDQDRSKRPSQIGLCTTIPAQFWTVVDTLHNKTYVVDTGAARSCIVANSTEKARRLIAQLTAANGSKINIFDVRNITLVIGTPPKKIVFPFYMTDIAHNLNGCDLLAFYGTKLDVLKRSITFSTEKTPQLLNRDLVKYSTFQQSDSDYTDSSLNPLTKPFLPDNASSTYPVNHVLGVSERMPNPTTVPACMEMVTNLYNEFSTLFKEKFFLHPTKHNVLQYIRTESPPCSAAVRRLSPDKLRILRTEIEQLLELGIIGESEGSWGSPAHLVPKPGGKWRLVCDYRALNAQTVADTYALPLLTDFANDLSGSQIFTSLDLYKSYHQIQIAETDQCKSTMVTPIGSYK